MNFWGSHYIGPYIALGLGADRIGFFETGPDRTGSEPKIRFTGPDRTGSRIFSSYYASNRIITGLHKNQPCLWNFYSPVSSWQKFSLLMYILDAMNHKNNVMSSLEYKYHIIWHISIRTSNFPDWTLFSGKLLCREIDVWLYLLYIIQLLNA